MYENFENGLKCVKTCKRFNNVLKRVCPQVSKRFKASFTRFKHLKHVQNHLQAEAFKLYLNIRFKTY